MPSYIETAKKGLVYVSPKGTEFRDLRYRVIPQERIRRSQTFEFIEKDGTYVQDLGLSSKTYTLSLYFSGDDHHERADAFEAAFEERGAGVIVFPLDGSTSRRVILLKLKRENRYVEAENVTYFEVDCHETTEGGDVDYILGENSDRVSTNRKAALDAQAQSFRDKFLGKAFDLKAVSLIRNRVAKARSVFGAALGAAQAARTGFESVATALDSNANLLIEQPLLVARQIQALLNTPVFPTVSQTMAAYGGFINGFGDYRRLLGAYAKTAFSIDEVFLLSASMAYMGRVASAGFQSRGEAVSAFSAATDSYEQAMAYLSGAEAALANERLDLRYYMAPDTYAGAMRAMRAFSGGLDDILLGLRRESIVVLEADTTPLNIAAAFYPDSFRRDQVSTLEFVISTNSLSGDQILLVPKGFELKVLV